MKLPGLILALLLITGSAHAACGDDPCLNADVQTIRDDVAVIRSSLNSIRNDLIAADLAANAKGLQHCLWVNAGLMMILIAMQGRPGKYPGK